MANPHLRSRKFYTPSSEDEVEGCFLINLTIHSYLFTYSIIYLYQYEIIYIYFIVWIITQFYWIYCSSRSICGHWELFQLAPRSLWHTTIIVGVLFLSLFQTLPYFLALQDVPGSSDIFRLQDVVIPPSWWPKLQCLSH